MIIGNPWKRPLEAQRFRLELHPMLQILERLQGEIEEVPRAAGRVEHREHAQPVEERPVPPLGRVQPFRAGGWRFGGFHSIQGAGEIGLRRVPLGQPRADPGRDVACGKRAGGDARLRGRRAVDRVARAAARTLA